MKHIITTNAANSNGIAKVKAIADAVLNKHQPTRMTVKMIDSLGCGCFLVILGNGALLRDIAAALDNDGWID